MGSLSIAASACNGGRVTSAEPRSALDLLLRVDGSGVIQAVESLRGKWPSNPISAGADYYALLSMFCDAKSERAVRAGIEAVSHGEAESFQLEFPCRLADGETRLCVCAKPCRGAGAGVWVAHTDAGAPTEPRTQELEALGRLAGGVAHDFANLVTLIAGYSDILLQRLGARDPNRTEIEEIRNAAARGAAVTSQILNFIRKQTALPGALDLNALVAALMKFLRPVMREDISLVVTLDPQLGAVAADSAQMTRVIMNLVLNARDAMPDGGSIRIRTANAGGQVLLEISDNGLGMDRETLSRIFQPFFTTKNIGGTGLGLCTVRSIVEQAGGDVQVRSEPGLGSTFTICLPRARREDAIRPQPFQPRATHKATETILLVEDEQSVRRLLKHVLEEAGYGVLEADDGKHALSLLESWTVDLLLTDVVMPGLNGRELALQARAVQPDLKVIYMSGYTDDVLSGAGILGREVPFLRKPLELDSLTTRIREVLDTRALQ